MINIAASGKYQTRQETEYTLLDTYPTRIYLRLNNIKILRQCLLEYYTMKINYMTDDPKSDNASSHICGKVNFLWQINSD